MEHSQLGKVYKSKHPKMIQSSDRLQKARRKLHDEVLKEVENLKYERSMLFEKEKVLQKTIADFEGESLQGSRNELKYTILQRNVETNQKLYDDAAVESSRIAPYRRYRYLQHSHRGESRDAPGAGRPQ